MHSDNFDLLPEYKPDVMVIVTLLHSSRDILHDLCEDFRFADLEELLPVFSKFVYDKVEKLFSFTFHTFTCFDEVLRAFCSSDTLDVLRLHFLSQNLSDIVDNFDNLSRFTGSCPYLVCSGFAFYAAISQLKACQVLLSSFLAFYLALHDLSLVDLMHDRDIKDFPRPFRSMSFDSSDTPI